MTGVCLFERGVAAPACRPQNGDAMVADGKKEREIPVTVANAKEMNIIEAPNIHRRVIETVGSGIFLAERNNRLAYVNHAFVEVLGYNIKDDVIGLNFVDELFKEEEEKKVFLEKMKEVGFARGFELSYARKDGFIAYFSMTCNNVYDDRGKVIGCEGVLLDVTEQKKLEKEIAIEKIKLEQILAFDEQIGTIREFDTLVEFIVDQTAEILEAQKCSLMLVDQKTGELFIQQARGLDAKTVKETRLKLGEPLAGFVAQSKQPLLVKNVEYDERFRRANKMYYFSRSFMIVPVCVEEKIIGVINVTDKKMADHERAFNEIDLRILGAIARETAVAFSNVNLYKELSYLIITDPLTLIYNYRQFTNSLNYEIKRHDRYQGHLCLIMLDLDDFKSYNDTYGHIEGDALLRIVGKILTGHLRETDIVCRYGGEEFAVILPDITLDGARIVAEKIRKAMEEAPFNRKVTVSLGVAAYIKGLPPQDFVRRADEALYQAKYQGKNRVCVYEEQ
jgi:diguanylate cyclase (GGDEF)-like protein/PAS domain S-box-containing protein